MALTPGRSAGEPVMPMNDSLVVTDPARQRGIVFVSSLGAFMASLDSSIANIALPVISKDFGICTSQASWIVLVYLLCEVGLLPAFGKLADVRGYRKAFIAGFSMFTAGSLLCGVSAGLGSLLVGRTVQGIGGAFLFAMMMAVISVYLPPAVRGMAMGVVITTSAVGMGFGPSLGGLLTHAAHWRWIFFINLPVGVIALAAAARFIPSRHPPCREPRFDFFGASLAFLTLVAFIVALNMGREMGWASPTILGCLAASALGAVLFIRHEIACAYPVLDLQLMRNRGFSLAALASLPPFMTFSGVSFLLPFYLMQGRGLDPGSAGFAMAAAAAGQFLGPIAGALSDRIGARRICLGGMLLCAFSFVLLLVVERAPSLAIVVFALGTFGLAQGFIKPANLALALQFVPAEKKGVGSSLMGVLRSLGLVLGVASFETIFADFIPHAISLESMSLHQAQLPRDVLFHGFSAAFAFGLAISLVAAIMIMLVPRQDTQERLGG